MPSGNELTPKQRDNLFRVWSTCRNVAQTAKKCSVSPVTVRKYKKLGNWPKRGEKIVQKAEAINDDKAAFTLAHELQATNAFLNQAIASLIARIKSKITCPTCRGTGKRAGKECHACNGKGLLPAMNVCLKDFVILVELKKELLEVVEPEIPTDQTEDKIDQILTQLTPEVIAELARTVVEDIKKPDGPLDTGK